MFFHRQQGANHIIIFTASDDPFRDETQAYSRRLIDHGIDATVVSLPSPTNFPAAYMDDATREAPWMAIAIDALSRFLAGAGCR